MLIYIDESVCSPFDETVNIALSNLANAHRNGYHFIFAKMSTLKDIFENADIHDREKSIYKTIYAKYSQLSGIKNNLSIYILATTSTLVAECQQLEEKTIHRVPVNVFCNAVAIEPVNIIGEDKTDVEFYTHLAKAYATANKLNYRIAAFPVHGGGNQTGDTFRTYQDNNKITLCIVDSDIKAKDCVLGDTAKLVEENADERNILSSYYIINVHEAENMIPLKVLHEACEIPAHINSYEQINRNKENELTKYIDYKNPLMLSEILTHQKPCYQKYWKETTNVFIGHEKHSICLETGICNQKDDCKCILFEGFGSKILKKSISLIERKSPKKFAEDCNSIIHVTEWENISKIILAWSFAALKSSA